MNLVSLNSNEYLNTKSTIYKELGPVESSPQRHNDILLWIEFIHLFFQLREKKQFWNLNSYFLLFSHGYIILPTSGTSLVLT